MVCASRFSCKTCFGAHLALSYPVLPLAITLQAAVVVASTSRSGSARTRPPTSSIVCCTSYGYGLLWLGCARWSLLSCGCFVFQSYMSLDTHAESRALALDYLPVFRYRVVQPLVDKQAVRQASFSMMVQQCSCLPFVWGFLLPGWHR